MITAMNTGVTCGKQLGIQKKYRIFEIPNSLGFVN